MPARNKGITLVALIITIIILLILAIVTIAAISKSNIIKYAQNAQTDYKKATDNENTTLTRYEDDIQSSSKDFISKEKNYIGYYADVDGDGTVDGIIYADLAHSASGKWYNLTDGAFSYEAIENTKEYYISQTNYNGNNANGFGFGTHDVISVVSGTTGEDRFYVMALENLNKGIKKYSWCNNYGNLSATLTSTDFGKGQTNTNNIMNILVTEKKAESPYILRDDSDAIWANISEETTMGWFIPSLGEMNAFLYNLEISKENSKNKGLGEDYFWTSSIFDKDNAYYVDTCRR